MGPDEVRGLLSGGWSGGQSGGQSGSSPEGSPKGSPEGSPKGGPELAVGAVVTSSDFTGSQNCGISTRAPNRVPRLPVLVHVGVS